MDATLSSIPLASLLASVSRSLDVKSLEIESCQPLLLIIVALCPRLWSGSQHIVSRGGNVRGSGWQYWVDWVHRPKYPGKVPRVWSCLCDRTDPAMQPNVLVGGMLEAGFPSDPFLYPKPG